MKARRSPRKSLPLDMKRMGCLMLGVGAEWWWILPSCSLLRQHRNCSTSPRGLPDSLALRARVALLVRPEQIRHANLIEKVARKAGVFLSYFLDPGKAALWIQRDRACRHRLAPETRFQKNRGCEPSTTISTKAQYSQSREPHDHCHFRCRRYIASSDIAREPRHPAIAET
jgi:hypothetical protein